MNGSPSVFLVPHDSRWRYQFRAERKLLRSVLGSNVRAIEHIGSTAVPNLCAKPIIDILVGAPCFKAASRLIPLLLPIGYELVEQMTIAVPDRLFFHRGPEGLRTFHLSVVQYGGELWNEYLRFRECLRRFVTVASAYESLKQELAAQFPDSRPLYTMNKALFIRWVLEEACSGQQPPPGIWSSRRITGSR